MPDTIILRVALNNEAAVIDGLSKIDAAANQLRNKTITLNVKTNADGVSKDVIKLARAQAQAESAAARRASAEAKVAVAQANASAAASRAATQETKLTAQRERQTAAIQKQTAAVNELGRAQDNAEKSGNLLLKGIGTLGKMAAWQLAGDAISAVKNSVKEAFDTMKEVDSELATIRKVTGRSESEIRDLGNASYGVASRYGVEATSYLESVGTFARAGYKDAADALGELAIKTQLVGDVTPEVADKFLLSVDAAYKYQGSIESLSTVLDKANAVENNYATSIEKIAEGMPIVANVASTANMSIEETIAMLGTITAVTQESGTKAATAARALILNIMGDTTTEIEDGVRLTTEQVTDLSDILWKYSRDAMEAAQATGKIVDPMEAIAGLAKASQEGLLTEQELARIASDIGGKLRTNQLLALINNWDMFNEQLDTMKNSAGSADAEIGVMLDTWDAKTKQLSNSWTELVNNIVDTRGIKTALDGLTGMLSGVNDMITGQNRVNNLAQNYYEQGYSVEAAAMRAYAEVNGLVNEVTGLPDAKDIDINTPGIQEAIERLNEVNALSGDVTKNVTITTSGGMSGYASLWPGHAAGTTSAPGGPSLVNELGPELISANGLAWIAGGGQPTVTNLPRGAIVLNAQQTRRAMNGLGGMGVMPAYAGGTLSSTMGNTFTGGRIAGDFGIVGALVERYTISGLGMGSTYESGDGFSGRSGKIGITEEGLQDFYESAAGNSARNQAETPKAIEIMADAIAQGAKTLQNGNGGRGSGGGGGGAAVVDLKQAQKDLDDELKNLKAQAKLADNRGQHRLEGDIYGTAQDRIKEMLAEYRAQGYSDTSDEVLKLENLLFDYAEDQEKAYQHVWDEMEDALDGALKTINAKIEKAENENDIPGKMALYAEAQDKIADLIDEYLAAGYAPDSDEILRLTNLGYDYAGKQTGLRDSLYKDLISAIEGLKNSTDEANDLAEKQQAVEDARQAYENASRQRTVRIFNPVTGQWEWVANARDVQAAQERLQSAEKTLRDTEWQRAISAAKSDESALSGLIAGAPLAAAYDEANVTARGAFLQAMGAYTGGASYAGSAEANNRFQSSDSHDTVYNFNGVTITPDNPAYLTMQTLAKQLSVLNIM